MLPLQLTVPRGNSVGLVAEAVKREPELEQRLGEPLTSSGFLSCNFSDLVLLLLSSLPNENPHPWKTSGIDSTSLCSAHRLGGDILLASDLFCVGVTKHSRIQFAVANPGSWRRHREEGGQPS